MLTIPEMTSARDQLKNASAIIEAVRVLFLGAGYIHGARLLNGSVVLLADEITALDKAIGGARP